MKFTFVVPAPFVDGNRGLHPRHIPYFTLIAATNLARVEGVSAQVLDAFALDLSFEQILSRPELQHADTLCLPYSLDHREIEIDVVRALACLLRRRFPGKRLVMYNRFLVSHDLQEWMEDADFFLEGDFEHLFVEFARGLRTGRPLTELDGVTLKRGEELVRSPRVYYVADADLEFFPDFTLLPMDRYLMAPHRREETNVYYCETAKGCSWGRCTFCQENAARLKDRKSYRPRSPENVVAEIEHAIARYGAREFQFNNAQFQVEIDWLRRFNELLAGKKLAIKWSALSRADFLNEEIVLLLKQAGCYNILVGIESVEDGVCRSINKNSRVKATERAIRLLKNAGIGVTGSFLIGLPGDTPRNAFRSMRFALQTGIDYAQVFIAKWPDVSVLAPHRAEGTIDQRWDYSRFDFCGPVFIPRAYGSLLALKLVQQACFAYFYLHPRTIFNMLRKVRRPGDLLRLAMGGVTLLTLCLRPIKYLAQQLFETVKPPVSQAHEPS